MQSVRGFSTDSVINCLRMCAYDRVLTLVYCLMMMVNDEKGNREKDTDTRCIIDRRFHLVYEKEKRDGNFSLY